MMITENDIIKAERNYLDNLCEIDDKICIKHKGTIEDNEYFIEIENNIAYLFINDEQFYKGSEDECLNIVEFLEFYEEIKI